MQYAYKINLLTVVELINKVVYFIHEMHSNTWALGICLVKVFLLNNLQTGEKFMKLGIHLF